MRRTDDFSPIELRTRRREKGLTQIRLAYLCGIREKAVYEYEAGRSNPRPDIWKRIKQVLSGEVKKFPRLEQQAFKARKAEAVYRKPEFKFEAGHRYTVHGKSVGRYSRSPDLELEVFEYVGKVGIHHCFKETHAGWTRTYTDAQLIGKKIEEVEE